MYLGIDGGGTKTKTLLMDESLKTVHLEETGPSSIRTVTLEESLENIFAGIDACLKHAKAPVKSVFAGIGDVAGEKDAILMQNKLKNHPSLSKALITVKNDVHNAHTGALNGRPGIALILGTGSVAFGKDEYGKTHRAGGYSYKEGDFGSAYHLGTLALQKLGKAFDLRIDSSSFTDHLMTSFDIESFHDMVSLYDMYHTRRTDVANLARIVTEYADKGDRHTVDIIEKASDEVMNMIIAITKTLKIKNKEIALIGSLGQSNTLYTKRIQEKIMAFDSEYSVFNAKEDPAYGAALLAYQNTK